MPNRRKNPAERCKPTGLSLPANVLKRAQRVACSRGVSLSSWVRQLLVAALEEESSK